MKKKYGLFKVLSIMLLVILLVTYFVNDRQAVKNYLTPGDLIFNYLQSFSYFGETALFILVVGGFYGLLNKIPAYKKLLSLVVDKVNDKSKLFVVVTTVVLALISSLTGLNVLLLLIIPVFISVILLLGYDKLVAISATVGGVVVGLIGGIFVTIKDPVSYYGVSYTTIDKLVGLDSHYANLLPKILLLLLGVALLVWYIISHIKAVEEGNASYSLSDNDVLLVDVKEKTSKTNDKVKSKVRIWPLAVAFLVLFVLLVLGYLPWTDLFELKVFNEFHTWLLSLKIGDYAILSNLGFSELSTGSAGVLEAYGAFGAWAGFGEYLMAVVVIVITSVVLMLVYRIKFDEAMDGFLYGVKKMLPAVLVVMLSYTILMTSYNHGFFDTLVTAAGKQFGDNAVIHSLVVLLGSVLNVDLQYTSTFVFTTVTSGLSESANLAVYASMFQSLFGLVQIVGPTSILLIVGLSYLEVPYKTWLKYIWRFVVELLIIILLVLMIVSLL